MITFVIFTFKYVNDNKWLIKSQSDANKKGVDWYEVAYIKPVCFNEHCFEKCHEISCIGLCSHMYQCTRKDKDSLCKHINKLHSLRVQQFQDLSFSSPENENESFVPV